LSARGRAALPGYAARPVPTPWRPAAP
jgi:hypothetical protein